MTETKPTVNPTPKTRFQESGQNVSTHREMISSSAFQRACDFALLEYNHRVCSTAEPNPNGALAGYFRMLGAQEFLQELRRLGEPPVRLERGPDNSNLIHS